MQRKLLFLLLTMGLLFQGVNTYAVVLPSPVKTNTTEPDPVKVKSALEDFKNLSKKERKARIKAVKKELNNYKAKKRAAEPVTNTLLLVIIAILLPPLAVYLHQGEINSKFWIDLLLTLLFYVPGLIYALVVILGDK